MYKLRKDLRVNKDPLSKMILIVYRFGNWLFFIKNRIIFWYFFWTVYKVFNFLIVKLMANAEIGARCQIGEGLILYHGGNGIIIHPEVVLGSNVSILHQVTIGIDPLRGGKPPRIGNGVFIGTGARVIGEITIGDQAKIGANAVVLCDVPPLATAVGIPAKILGEPVSTPLSKSP